MNLRMENNHATTNLTLNKEQILKKINERISLIHDQFAEWDEGFDSEHRTRYFCDTINELQAFYRHLDNIIEKIGVERS